MKAEQVTRAGAYHGEGPVWWPDWGGLVHVDMLAGDLLRMDGSGNLHLRHVGTVAAALRPRASGGMVLARERDVVVAETLDGPLRVLAVVVEDPDLRCNEGCCDPAGNFYVGTLSRSGASDRAALHRVLPDGTVDTVVTSVSLSNGLGWTADGDCAYYVDTPTRRIDRFDHAPDDGLCNRRPFVSLPETAGLPDGLAVDAEGGVWVAMWEGSAVRRYSAGGVLEEVIQLPVRKVTACAFGGEQLDELYITTSRAGEDSPHPAAGAVFRAEPGVRGLPATTFAG
ncbi:SMP-30/gluconolactonase/LRE family protein [Streptomyces sp. NPDC020917]|uniref:SMP-30/gluconolactonase/LRE family protein n=1 Tax=Streptomyces sp. NPDC020917 TaxID=3365102 RepID=UPI003789628C